MARLESVSIKGIRSFDPNVESKITFEPTLNIICGKNGSGKTTILECLRLIFTGNYPALTRMSNFLNDHEISRTKSTKAKIQLIFRDKEGKQYRAIRSMISQLKNDKMEAKTLESSLESVECSRKVALSSRCSDFINEIFNLTSVSPPLMDYVIFCHHDDSCWPLGEAKILKERFDAIFCTTLYNKALESIRSVRSSNSSSLQHLQPVVDQLKQIEKKSQQIFMRIDEIQNEIEHKHNLCKDYESKISKSEHKIEILNHKIQNIDKIEHEISNLISNNDKLLQETKNMTKIHEFGYGSNLDVENEIASFQERIKVIETTIESIDENIIIISIEKDKYQEEITGKVIEVGVLEGRIKELRNKLYSINDIFEIDLSSSQFKFKSILKTFDNTISQMQDNHAELIEKHDAMINSINGQISTLQSSLDAKNLEIKNLDTLIKLKTESKTETMVKFSQIDRKINTILVDSTNHKDIENKLNDKNKILANLNKQDLDYIQSQIDGLENDIRNKKSEIEDLQDSLSFLNEKIHIAKQNEHIQQLISKNTSSIQKIIKKCINILPMSIIDPLIYSFEFIIDLLNKIIKLNSEYETEGMSLHRQISMFENEKSNYLEQLREKEKLLYLLSLEFEKNSLQISEPILEDLDAINREMEKNYRKIVKFKCLKRKDLKIVTDIQNGHTCPICLNTNFDECKVVEKIDSKIKLYCKKIRKHQKTQKCKQEHKIKCQSYFKEYENYQERKKRHQELLSDINAINTKLQRCEEKIAAHNKTLNEIISRNSQCNEALMEMRMAENIFTGNTELNKRIIPHVNVTTQDLENELSHIVSEISNLKKICDQQSKDSENYKETLKMINEEKLNTTNDIFNLQNRLLNLQSNKGLMKELYTQKESFDLASIQIDEFIKNLKNKKETEKLMTLEMKTTFDKLSNELNFYLNSKNTDISNFKIVNSRLETIRKEIEMNKREKTNSKLRDYNHIINSLKAKFYQAKLELEKNQKKKSEILKELNNITKCINKLQIYKIYLIKINDIENNEKQIRQLKTEILNISNHSDLKKKYSLKINKLSNYNNSLHQIQGSLTELKKHKLDLVKDLQNPPYLNSKPSLLKKMTESKVLNMITNDLDEYYAAFDYAINKYHSEKIKEINKVINMFWKIAYKSDDIAGIKIVSEIDHSASSKQRRSYNYGVLMIQNECETDMRGRCSAGQKMIASIVIRLALFTAFCTDCSFVAFDEPTTNLDEYNLQGLADAFRKLSTHKKLKNFQLILITHDETFLRYLCHDQDVKDYFEIYKNRNGKSTIVKKKISELCI